MNYPGDPAVSPEIRQRIYQTFRQAVELALRGNRQEALLGCDFVLRLDPRFDLARHLADSIQRGASPENLQGFLARIPQEAGREAPRPGSSSPPAPDLGELESLSLEAPEIPAGTDPVSTDLRGELQRLAERRNWAELLERAEREQRRIAADPALRALVEEASSKMEAEPYIKSFLESARQARALGEREEMERLLRKARALDPTHPDLLAFEAPAPAALPEPDPGLRPEAAPGPDLELPGFDLGGPLDLGTGFDLGPSLPDPGPTAAAPAPGSDRVSQLLAEGQRAFDLGQLQAAIDAWSRIFLIDIDHAEAARRIEMARQLKAEREREVEELFHEAVQQYEAGELEEAETLLRRVLDLSPGYALAEEYLGRIESGQRPGAQPSTVPAAGSSPLALPSLAQPAQERLSQEILVPPDPEALEAGRAPALEGDRDFAIAAKAPKRSSFPSPKFLAIGSLALVLLAGGSWLVASRWSKLFPNSKSGVQPAAGPTGAERLARAQELQKAGQTAQAIAELKRIPAQDPASIEAQLLVTQWERLLADASKPALNPAQANRRRFLIEQARGALDAGDAVAARAHLERARALAPLDEDSGRLLTQAREALKPWSEELRIFEQGDFEYAATLLWRRRQESGAGPLLDRFLAASYFNLGLSDLQRGDPAKAAERFKEAADLLGGRDAELEKLQRFCALYRERPQDLLYRVFTSQLEPR